jgi:beta-galactosidase
MIKQSFDPGWEYTDVARTFLNRFIQWQPVHLPHDLSIAKPRSQQNPTGAAGGYAWSGVVTYRKKFTAPRDWKDKAVQVEFEGVYMSAGVSINGHVALQHPYGYTSFIVDLKPYLKYGEENELTVVANNSAQPNSRWYSGTGIYRHVWLRLGGEVYIRPWGVSVTTPRVDPAASTVAAATEIANDTGAIARATLRTILLDPAGEPVAQVETPVDIGPQSVQTVAQTLSVANARLWSVDDPNLYTLTSELLLASGVVDAETIRFGFRTIAVDAQNGFRLNGLPLKLKGGCVHHDNGLLGAASFDRAEERKIELMKAAGYNAIRCAHNPPAPAMLDACDRLGMLVIDETFDCWRMGKNPNDYHLFFDDWWQRDTEAMVRRDRNHPSIIMWSIGNEVGERTGASDGYTLCRRQADFVRSLDHTRLVTSDIPFLFESLEGPGEEQAPPENIDLDALFEKLLVPAADPRQDRWGLVTREFVEPLDVAGYNYLYKRYETDGQRFPGRIICGTETWPHQAYEFWNETLRLPYVIGDFVWTSLDYLGESGIGKVSVGEGQPFFAADPWPYHLANCGDIDICGFKRPQSYYRDILWGERTEPFIAVLDPKDFGQKLSFNQWGWEPVIESWTFPGWEGKPTRVEVYAAGEEVELLVNGVSAGRQPAGAASRNKAVFEVTYQPGELEVVAYTGGVETGRDRLATASAPAALRLTSDRAALKAAYGDLAYVTVEIVDEAGRVVRWAGHEVACEVDGAGDLLAVGAADPLSEELYTASRRKAFEGRLMAVVRASGQAGEIRLKASAEGLAPAEVRLRAG